MEEEQLDEEFSIMYEESERVKVLNSDTFRRPIKNLKVRKPVTIDRNSSVKDAVALMQQKQFGCLLVTNGEKLAGIMTERDIVMKALNKGKQLESLTVQEIMTADPESLQPDDTIAFVMNAMHAGGYRHVPIVNDRNIPLAVISVKDIIGFVVENFSEEILNLPPHPLRKSPQQDGG